MSTRIFSCPEEGCLKRYQRYSYLQKHLDSGKHVRAVEREPLLDQAVYGCAERLEIQTAGVQSVRNVQEVSKEVPLQAILPMGWALRSSGITSKGFTARQKEYLTTKFTIGETTSCKADPVIVARDMMKPRGSDGERLFSSDEFVTSQEITSFFSRLAAKKSFSVMDGTDENNAEAVEFESCLEELTNGVRREVFLFDCHNICDLVRQGKLNKFNKQ